MFPRRVELHLPRGSHEWMPMQDDNLFFPVSFCGAFSTAGQIPILPPQNNLMTEAAELSERVCPLAKNKCSGQKSFPAAGQVPEARDGSGDKILFVQPHRRAAGEIFAGNNCFGDIGKKFRAWLRVRVHKNQPVAGRRRRAGIRRAGNLISDGFKHDYCARPPCDFRRAVGGIIVAHDQFKFPATLCVNASAADLICASDSPSSRSSLNAGMMMEIFLLRTKVAVNA